MIYIIVCIIIAIVLGIKFCEKENDSEMFFPFIYAGFMIGFLVWLCVGHFFVQDRLIAFETEEAIISKENGTYFDKSKRTYLTKEGKVRKFSVDADVYIIYIEKDEEARVKITDYQYDSDVIYLFAINHAKDEITFYVPHE